MPDILLILHRGPEAPLAWLVLDPRGAPRGGVATGSELPPAMRAGIERVVVLWPAEQATVLTADVPARSHERLAKALPYAVEDRLIDPVDQLHLAFDEPAGGGQRVVAIRRDRVRAWLDDLAARGVEPDAARLDALALPWRAGTATLAVDAGGGARRVLLRAGEALVWAGLEAELPDWFDVLAAGLPHPRPVALVGREMPAALPGGITLEQPDARQDLLAVLAAEVVAGRAGPELLGGDFTPARRGARGRRLARSAAGLAAALVLLLLADLVAGNLALSRRADALAAAQRALYREAYPGAPDTPDPRARIEADLGALAPGADRGDALALIAAVAPLATRSQRLALRALEYRNGALELALVGDGLAALDALRESIAVTPGLRAELAQVSTGARGTEGRIVVRQAGP